MEITKTYINMVVGWVDRSRNLGSICLKSDRQTMSLFVSHAECRLHNS